MDKEKIISRAEAYVKKELEKDSSGHDWWHICRVRNLALDIARKEKADKFVTVLSALLHDIADEKLNTSKEAGLQKVSDWLENNQVGETEKSHIKEIISTMSFSAGKKMTTLEGKIVQDADRLDAIGAIGIARVFSYAGWKGNIMHDPGVKPRDSFTKEEYRSNNNTAVNHFYEKLLKLKDSMNTEYARRLAEERHQFMESYLKQFYKEWDLNE
jgi:uncharacterized protein